MRISRVVILAAVVLAAASAAAQDVSPAISFDPSSNVTTVRVALAVSSNLELRFNRRFTGRSPAEAAGWIGFAFGNNTESGVHDLSLSLDSTVLTFRFPDYSSFQLPRELLMRMAAAGSVEGSWDGARFAILQPQRDGIRRFLDAINPPNLAVLDQARIEHWPLEKTIEYVNDLLRTNPASPCSLTRLEARDGALHVFSRGCDESFDNSDMSAPAARLQQRSLLYINGAISLDCSARASCAETRRRSSAKEDWLSAGNTWTWLRVEMGQTNPEAAEKVRNALEYLLMQMKAQ